MNMSPHSRRAGSAAPHFLPLTHADFLRLDHSPSLKGLLRPFTGKGLESWASDVVLLRDGVVNLAQTVLMRANRYPFTLLKVSLTRQTTGAGTTFLRWRNADRSAMGVGQWARLVESTTTPLSLLDDLLALELQRVVLNMQISLTHTIARQAHECALKIAQAETVYRRRVDRNVNQETS